VGCESASAWLNSKSEQKMLRDEYLRRLVDNAHVDLYLSGNDGARIYWPWRMQPAHEAAMSYRNACESYMVDSAFSQDDITNIDVLDKAHQLDSEYAFLADVYHDAEGTVDAILEGLELYDDHPYDGKIVAPIQAPHDESFMKLEGQGLDCVAVGGMKDKSKREQIAATKSLRAVAGESVELHGLGFTLSNYDGSPNQWVSAINENPNLLDSMDTSSYLQQVMMNEYAVDDGKERRSVDCMQIGTMLVRDLRRISTFAEPDTQTTQKTLVG